MNCIIITSTDAYKKLNSNKNSVLIDVRTSEEWRSLGIPKLKLSQIEFLSWPISSDQSLIEDFTENLKNLIEQKNKISSSNNDINTESQTLELFFICKAGVRSALAAQVAQNNFDLPCYNIIDGFEGINDNFGAKLGWKRNNLPWQQI